MSTPRARQKYDAMPDKVSDSKLTAIFGSTERDKPSWMYNDYVRDPKWIVPRVGFKPDPSGRGGRPKHTLVVDFTREVAPGTCLTDPGWQNVLHDIQDSCLYLDLTGAVTRPFRFAAFVSEICGLLYFLNERADETSSRRILSLAQITDGDIVEYIRSFEIDPDLFKTTLTFVLSTYPDKASIDWSEVREKHCSSRRQLMTLQDRLHDYLAKHHPRFRPPISLRREFLSATADFDVDADLSPNERSITNRIGLLEMAFISSSVQRDPLRHSARRVCGDGKAIIDSYKATSKTPAIPFRVAVHTLSSALAFCRSYGTALVSYLKALDTRLRNIAGERGLMLSSAVAQAGISIREDAFRSTPQPPELAPLRINSWTRWGSTYDGERYFRTAMPLGIAFSLYTAAFWTIVNSFAATRFISIRTLRRSCFEESPLDGLFDIRLLQAKASSRNELEEIFRPIPGLVFDIGLDYAAAATYLDSRRGIEDDDDDSYLFNKASTEKSVRAHVGNLTSEALFRSPISGDTLQRCIDRFLDWCESPLIDGKRWYFSSHQLRRLFAILYFNMSGDAGLEELSWFLGHESLDMTFHYAEIDPSDDWIDEAIKTIATIGASLERTLKADPAISAVIESARSTGVTLALESVIESAIRDHIEKTGDEVRFRRIENRDIFFYFAKGSP